MMMRRRRKKNQSHDPHHCLCFLLYLLHSRLLMFALESRRTTKMMKMKRKTTLQQKKTYSQNSQAPNIFQLSRRLPEQHEHTNITQPRKTQETRRRQSKEKNEASKEEKEAQKKKRRKTMMMILRMKPVKWKLDQLHQHHHRSDQGRCAGERVGGAADRNQQHTRRNNINRNEIPSKAIPLALSRLESQLLSVCVPVDGFLLVCLIVCFLIQAEPIFCMIGIDLLTCNSGSSLLLPREPE